MAGSYGRITTDEGKFCGVEMIDNLGDAKEALEECYGMIWWLATLVRNPQVAHSLLWDRPIHDIVEHARSHYEDGIGVSPGIKASDE